MKKIYESRTVKESIRQKLAASKRTIVLEEVSHLFETEGLASLKMQDIAERLGMSVGALYKLFASKEALYHAYVAFQIERFYDALQEACRAEADARACLARYVQMKFDTFRQKRKAVEESAATDAFFFLKLHTRHEDPAQPVFRWLAERFAALSREMPLRYDDMDKIAHLFNAFSTGYVEYWLKSGKGMESDGEEVVATFLEGMKRP